MKVQDILTDEGKWTRGHFARNKDGKSVDKFSPDAVCWCLWGAIEVAYGEDSKAEAKLRNHLLKIRNSASISYFNDMEATFPEVRALIEELDI